MKRGFFDVRTPFFNPLWRRVVAVVLPSAWALVELMNGQPFWAVVFGASAAFLAWQFFVVWVPSPPDED
ncbi:MAG: hypothetical protein WBA02_15785 [Jannaschia helgolandensis]|uniref:DUF3329 domain-containing protein n=1 Tax=Jannaschia helgolandensis TaxID=188906 RepID=A0A1H7T467_9RHOB|nr:hypothetical protein [Jannaschia helgolandensis]SEL79641.1 hypothetical protein SAMN04488526_3556 [Jannaschia helgolandensis]